MSIVVVRSLDTQAAFQAVEVAVAYNHWHKRSQQLELKVQQMLTIGINHHMIEHQNL